MAESVILSEKATPHVCLVCGQLICISRIATDGQSKAIAPYFSLSYQWIVK